MLRSITNIWESFLLGGGRLTFRGLRRIAINVIVTWTLVGVILTRGSLLPEFDLLDIAIESGAVIVHFLVYCLIALIPLKRWIKRNLIIGLLMTQLGLLVDLIDEIIVIGLDFWHTLGDSLYLVGAIFVAFGATNWVVYNYRMSTLDKLTHVHNRRFFEAILTQYLQRLQRAPEPASLINLDIDDFKAINDQYGHHKGDEILRHVARVLKKQCRDADVICRSGGEEFEVMLPGANTEQAKAIAERLLVSLQQGLPEQVKGLTASIGITNICDQDNTDTVRKRADDAMYNAKRAGKAQIVVQTKAL